jgi:hypothetical protein
MIQGCSSISNSKKLTYALHMAVMGILLEQSLYMAVMGILLEQCGRNLLQRNILPPSARMKNNPSQHKASNIHVLLSYSLTLEPVHSSKPLVTFYRTTVISSSEVTAVDIHPGMGL